jgi:hypothetical protein
MPNTDKIIKWVDARIETILTRPGMWGGREALELQILQLTEFRKLMLEPEALETNPRLIVNAWISQSRKPLHTLEVTDAEFVQQLKKLADTLKNA